MNSHIYKVMSARQWDAARTAGALSGVGIDVNDGFIHLSAADQVVETVKKHFAGQTDLVLLKVDTNQLGDTLRWEKSRDDMLFPHVYGDIPLSAVVEDVPLPLGEDGQHHFPTI